MVDPIKVIKGLLGAEADLADFIQNGPSTGFPGYVRDRFRDRCNEFGNLPPWARALSGVAGGSISRFCSPYWGDNGWDGPQIASSGPSGGQCQGVGYSVFYDSFNPNDGTPNPNNPIQLNNMTGPISVVTNNDAPVGCPAPSFGQASQTLVGFDSTQPLRGPGCVQFNTARNVVFTRLDGQPDECGDAEPPTIQPGPNPPPNPGPLPGPEPRDNPDPTNPIPFLPIPPFNDPVFGPQPVTGPEPTAPQPPQPTGDNLPGDPDAIGNPIGDGVAGDEGEDFDFGQPPMGKIWVGCLVEFSVDNAYGNIPNTGPQNTVYPLTVGNVSLRYGSLRGTSNQVRSRFTELFRPNTALEVTGAFVQTRPNTSAIVRPISVTVCKETQCSGE